MLISHAHKFLFLKSHKTASTTCELFLQSFCVPDEYEFEMEGPAYEGETGIVGARGTKSQQVDDAPRWTGHMGIKNIEDRLGEHALDGYTVITSIRNPFDRAVSQFHFNHHFRGLPPFTNAQDAIKAFETADFKVGFPSDYHLLHKAGKYVAHYTLRFENLRSDIAEMCDALSLNVDGKTLPHLRKAQQHSLGLSTADYFRSQETVDVIRKKDAWIFDLFDYPALPAQHKV